ncbi:MAG: extracellular solute-binding protein [Lachnospiraceae bacterium]|nr:extracellular solute-binding protein [Lachnospiraceae bacterium]
MKRKNGIKRILAFALAAVLILSLAGCGKDEGQSVAEGFVYVPEFVDLTPEEGEDSMNDPTLRGESLYYSVYEWNEETGSEQKYYCWNLTTGEKTVMPLDLKIEGADWSYPMSGLNFDQDNNIICMMNASKSDESGNYSQTFYMLKFDAEGNKLLEQDITEAMKLEGSDNSYAQAVVVDKEGRVYLNVSGGGMNGGNSFIVVLDAEGKLLAQIDTGTDWISAMGIAADGTVLITRYGNGVGMECLEVDLANKSMGKSHEGVPNSYNSGSLISTPDGGLLVNDGTRLWKYDLATETAEEILTWTDCDINGSYVQMIQTLEDGRIAVLSRNWSSNTQELAYLTRTEAAKVTQKQIITLATMWSNQDLQEAVVKFNKQSDTYKVRIVAYYDDSTEWTETKYQDAMTALNNAITSSNCPDIIDLSYGNVNSYVSKGLLMDLSPYLENSSVKREDLLESVLDAYTFGDTLVCVPTGFTISTIMGRTSQLGNRTSWTIKDIMEFAAQYPDAKLFNYSSKGSMLSTCLQYSSEAFIDYNNGKCNFESQDFLDILEFCNTFETETDWDREGESFPKQISEGKILLNDVSLWEMTEMQMYSLMFNEPVTFIGYPTVDGSSGNRINGQNCYAITTKCKNPDGAWAFIESMLQYEPQKEYGGMNNFSIRKDMLDESFEMAMKENGSFDENGEPYLDENGEPMIWPKTTWMYNDWEAEIYAATPEQVQAVRDLIDTAVAATNNDETVLTIIQEEAQAYFEGQKSAQDVANVIQSRVQTYISENS